MKRKYVLWDQALQALMKVLVIGSGRRERSRAKMRLDDPKQQSPIPGIGQLRMP